MHESRYKSKPLLLRPFIALRVALEGLAAAWRYEVPFRLEILAFLIFFPLAFWVGKTAVERALLALVPLAVRLPVPQRHAFGQAVVALVYALAVAGGVCALVWTR